MRLVSLFRCPKPGCAGHLTEGEALLQGQHHLAAQLADVTTTLDIIRKEQEKNMAELDDELAGINAAEATEHTDVLRVIADLEAKDTAGTITDDERTQLEALKATIAADAAAIDAGDPQPVVTDPTPADSSGDVPVDGTAAAE